MSGAARTEFNRSSFAVSLCVEDDTPHGCGLTHGRQDRFSCVVVRSAHFPTHTPSLLSQLLQGWTSVIKAVAGLPRNAGTADTHLDSVFSTLEVCVQVRILRAAAIWTSL
ncbi:peptide hydrolase, partial [Trypanosoma cruzi]